MSAAAAVRTVCICGGGKSATVSAGYIASKAGYRVNVLTRRPADWAESVHVTTKGSRWEHKGDFVGKLSRVSSNPADVIPNADIVLVAAPAHAHPPILRAIAPHARRGQAIGTLFAQGAFDWAARAALGPKLGEIDVVFGLQNIPWICTTLEYGKSAKILGPKDQLFVATHPVEKQDDTARLLADVFDIPCATVPNFLCLTLTPSNQIIHPARYRSIFRDFDGKRTYSKEELAARNGLTLYADMDELGAEQLAVLDNELQQVKHGLVARYPALDLSSVYPIGERIVRQYGDDVGDASSLRRIFATNRGYAGCGTPLKEVSPGRFQPATESRLFVEDMPYGLCILKSLALLLGLPTPCIDLHLRWHQQFMPQTYLLDDGTLNPAHISETGTPQAYGLNSLDDIVRSALPKEARARL